MRLFFKKTGSFSARGNAKGSGETLFHRHLSNSEKGFSILENSNLDIHIAKNLGNAAELLTNLSKDSINK